VQKIEGGNSEYFEEYEEGIESMEGGRKKERYEQEFEKDWKPDYPEFAVN
jgi:hypothetical protein